MLSANSKEDKLKYEEKLGCIELIKTKYMVM